MSHIPRLNVVRTYWLFIRGSGNDHRITVDKERRPPRRRLIRVLSVSGHPGGWGGVTLGRVNHPLVEVLTDQTNVGLRPTPRVRPRRTGADAILDGEIYNVTPLSNRSSLTPPTRQSPSPVTDKRLATPFYSHKIVSRIGLTIRDWLMFLQGWKREGEG